MLRRIFICMLVLSIVFTATCISSPAFASAMTISFAHNYPEISPAHMAATAFKEYVEEQTNGGIRVNIFPAMQLGSNREQLEGIQQGSIHVGLQPSAILGNFVPEFQILDLPFIFPSEEVMWKVLDGEFGQYLFAKLEERGIRGLGFAWTGFKQITSNRELTGLASLRGQKIRVMDSPLLLEQYRAWGSAPTAIDFSELYSALQQGVVDGQENNQWTNQIRNFHEVQRYFMISNHAPLPAQYMANKAWYDSLSPEYQRIIDEAGRICYQTDRENLSLQEQESVRIIKEQRRDVVFYELNDSEIQEFIDACAPVYEFVKRTLGEDLYDALIAAVEANS